MSKLTIIKEAVLDVQETIGHIKKGAFHKWLGKSEDEPITAADIKKGKAAGGHAAKMAVFAQNFGHVQEAYEHGVGDVVSVHQHKHGVDMGHYGKFNVEKVTKTHVHVYNHKQKSTMVFNKNSGRGIGEHDTLMLKEETLTELSKKTLGSYVNKAADDYATHNADMAQHRGAMGPSMKKSVQKFVRRRLGITKAVSKITKEEGVKASAIENMKQNSGEKLNIKEETIISPHGHHYEVKPAHQEHYLNSHTPGHQGTLSTGQKAEQFNVYHNGEHIGHVHSYSAYKDTKKPGSRIVTSRKDVRHWGLQLNHGHHSEKYNWGGKVKEGSHSDMKFSTKSNALDQLMRSHAHHLEQKSASHTPVSESMTQYAGITVHGLKRPGHHEDEDHQHIHKLVRQVTSGGGWSAGGGPRYLVGHEDHKKVIDHLKNHNIQVSEAIKGWKHAHSDIMKHRADQHNEAMPVRLVRLNKDGKESGMHDATKHLSSISAAHEWHQNIVKLNPGKHVAHHVYHQGQKVGKLVNGDLVKEETVNEVLSKNASSSEFVDDFVHSKNKMFKGDSKAQRIKRALGAYYGQHNEETIVEAHKYHRIWIHFNGRAHEVWGENHEGQSRKIKGSLRPTDAKVEASLTAKKHGLIRHETEWKKP
jgi:hypothetical protein